jgi:hypothetical protein
MEICSVRHSSYLFTVHADRKEMSAYMSDLEANNPFGRAEGVVYDDACDAGFKIVSDKTGKEATFAQSGTKHSRSGDEVMAWTYEPTRDTLRKIPQLKGWTITLIND